MVLPVWPTCSPCGRHPASTTAREAPRAAVGPSASRTSSITPQFSGPRRPRPPDTTISASATSTLPPEAARKSTAVPPAGAPPAGVKTSTRPAAGRVPGGNTWGRSDTTAGLASKATRANAFPP